jgi:phage-related protein
MFGGASAHPGVGQEFVEAVDRMVLFTVDGHVMILLHGFIKKTRKTPRKEIGTARARLKQYQEAES